ncbi:MAG TPA: SDR family NAD(P)-dependent oxidoreductase [Acidimicrobiales bacterium]
MPPRPELPGPVAVVTGASRGLGAGMASTFAEHGYRLGLCARTRPTAPPGAEAVTEVVDVTDAEAVDRFGSMVAARFGRIDLWVNNAGVLEPIDFLVDADASALSHHVDVNVKGMLFGSKTFVRHVRERVGTGVLVNMTSGAARTVYEGMAVYCATKAAVDMATRVIASEEAPHGLMAYAVAPGVVDTGMQVLMREAPVERLPSANRFVALKEAEAFNSPNWVARFLIDLVEGRQHPQDVVVRVPDQG